MELDLTWNLEKPIRKIYKLQDAVNATPFKFHSFAIFCDLLLLDNISPLCPLFLYCI